MTSRPSVPLASPRAAARGGWHQKLTLGLKINLIVSTVAAIFLVVVAGLEVRAMRESVEEETIAATRVAGQLLNRTAWLYASQGTPAMLSFLRGLGRVRSNEIALYDGEGHELYHSPPSPYKAGRNAPAWFAALIAPMPSTQTFRFPDGRLEVEANASRSELDAWDELVRLVGVALLLLAAFAFAVFWLVGRAVKPFGQIVSALEYVESGRFHVQLPEFSDRETGTIGAAYNRMVAQLQMHVEAERRAAKAELLLTDSLELRQRIDRHLEEERRMIARELHDELGQSVTAMRSMALSIAQRVEQVDDQAASAARMIAKESSRLYDAMHGMIPRLTPLTLDSIGLAEALRDLVERTRRSQPGLDISADITLDGVLLSADAALVLFRAAQEAITNSIQHGKARAIAIEVSATPTTVALVATDDGGGMPAEGLPEQGHYGLRWIQERTDSAYGQLQLERLQPHGLRLRVVLPLEAPRS